MSVSFDDPNVTLLFNQQVCLGFKLKPYPHESPVHAYAGKCSDLIRKSYKAHASIQSFSVEALAMSCMSMTEPPSAWLVLQRISNVRDVSEICATSVGVGLLVAV